MTLKKLRTAFALTPILLVCLSTVADAASRLTPPATDDPVVALVDSTVIRRSDLIVAQQLLPQQYRKAPLAALYPVLLKQVVDNTLILRAARAEGIDKTPAVRQRLVAIERRLVEGAYLEHASKGRITEDAMRKRYGNVIEALSGKEEVRVRHILVKKKSEAEDIIEELADGADFAKLALENSMGPSKTQGGDLGYMGRNALVKPFADAAFGLKIGQVTPMPIETQFGWHVIKLDDRRAMKVPDFEEMRPQLARQIRTLIADELVKKLRRRATMQRYDINGKPMPTSASR